MPPKKKVRPELPTIPVTWQWLSDDNVWCDYAPADQAVLEDYYGKKIAQFDVSTFSFSQGVKLKYDLKAMTQTNAETGSTRKICRLGKGIWEFKDDHGLFTSFYDEDNATIELAWRKNQTGTFSTKALSWNVGYDSQYVFTFSQDASGNVVAVQKNMDSGTERQLRRTQPEPGSEVWDTKSYGIAAIAPPTEPATATGGGSSVVLSIFQPPETWCEQTKNLEYHDVAAASAEFTSIIAPFKKTLQQDCTILSVKRIQNKTLWRFYALTRYRVASRNKGDANEMQLYHGARVRENMNAIQEFGFDMRVARNGSVGTGIYFAVNSSYSNGGYVLRNPDGTKEMYVCRVAVGTHTQGRHDLKRPPPKTGKKAEAGELYDSVHNGKPISMYVVFDNTQAYPEYIIHYKPAKW